MKLRGTKKTDGARCRGIALIIVMLVIVAFGILAGGFAYSMKVETRLARNRSHEAEYEWLARSGIELARLLLSEQSRLTPQYDALNQKWAGGTGDTNEVFAGLSLENNELGSGRFSVTITDLDRRMNVNTADELMLQQALILIGVDAGDFPTIVDSILDWRDPDEDERLSGKESDYYLGLDLNGRGTWADVPWIDGPPYEARNGPIDDLSELLLIHGITSEIYLGPAGGQDDHGTRLHREFGRLETSESPAYAVGMVDLFTYVSSGLININTADMTALQLIPLVDENLARAIIRERSGLDEMEGTEDDLPYQSVAELARAEGMYPELRSQMTRYCTTKSLAFEVRVDVQIGMHRREYVAVLYRASQQEIPMLSFNWQ
jgi:general secretion pathway protein K